MSKFSDNHDIFKLSIIIVYKIHTILDDYTNIFEIVYWSYFYFVFGIFKLVLALGKLLLGKSVIIFHYQK